MDVGTLQSITEGNSKTPRLPRMFPQKPQISGSEMGREGGREGGRSHLHFPRIPRSNERRSHCLPFRSAVEGGVEPSFVVLSVDRNLLLCARCLSLRPLQNRSCFIQSCTFFSGSKRHRRKDHHVVAGFRVGHADGISCVPFSLCFALPHVRLVIYLVVMGLG